MSGTLHNWAGNVTFTARRLHRPESVDELRRLVARAGRVRALGTGHSFNRLADTDGDLVSLAGLPPLVRIDPRRHTVTVAAGVRYGELAARLHREGYALTNLASLPHITVAGACATGTHGSGDRVGGLATAVAGLDLVTATGELVRLTRDDDPRFPGAVVALGALGVVTALTLDLVPHYDVAQRVYRDLPFAALVERHAEIFASGYSVSAFTDWAGPTVDQVWVKQVVAAPPLSVDALPLSDGGPERWGARPAAGPCHPVHGMPVENCTTQLGVPGPWHTRLPHFRLDFTPSSGAELQSEYLLPRARAAEALTAVDAIRHRIAPVLQVSEVRTVAADDLWLSPAYRRDSLAIHFTWIADTAAVTPVIDAVEEALAPLAPRPHWGKLFRTDVERVQAGYDRLADFRALRRDLDPDGRFGNELVDRYLD
ncbi:FAD-binding protein [Micromonospora echinofusca]|uniref:FAD-binding protein n=1 Tax=Micromonospora echinofusca TaxID=47858 RepID=A0ABS3VPL8_MICEH|nr:FAD-binding protein [Micromonospora echinofusca]MBO4206452.1 FAD-binding protein [Micromonospora echinofusca]